MYCIPYIYIVHQSKKKIISEDMTTNVDMLRPFFIKIESYDKDGSDSVIYYNVDIISEELLVTVRRRYSDFSEVSCQIPIECVFILIL